MNPTTEELIKELEVDTREGFTKHKHYIMGILKGRLDVLQEVEDFRSYHLIYDCEMDYIEKEIAKIKEVLKE